MTQHYRIEELFTCGWELIDESAKNLTREQCDKLIEQYLSQGYNANCIRVIPDVQS